MKKIKEFFSKLKSIKWKELRPKDIIQAIKNSNFKFQYVALVVCPIVTFYLFEFYTHNPFDTMYFEVQLLNIVFFELVAFLLYFLFRSIRCALITETAFFMVVGLANYFVLQFRSVPIMPWDLLSISTAASVAKNYSYKFEASTIIVLIGFVLLIVIEFFTKYRPAKNLKKKLIGCLATLVLLCGYVFMFRFPKVVQAFDLYVKLFTPTTMQYKDGTAVAFIYETQFMSVSTPSGYSKADAEAILDEYTSEETEITRKPNIIVIMDETFSDLRCLGDFKTNMEFMPYIDSLLAGADNTISGTLNVSVLAGNTPNSEFEFLTGNSLAFLPQGSVPYQQYINKTIPSLVSYMNNLGYKTIGMHPYNAGGWNRDFVYPTLGFDEYYFIEDIKPAKYIRKYISDKTCFNKIINFFENKESGEPFFLFNVTMQNHSAFTQKYDNFTPTVKVDGSKCFPLSNYLSLLKETDTAFKNFVDYFSRVDEDTIIVFYGDHQPNDTVADGLWELFGVDRTNLTLEQERSRYLTPFVIWANFDINEKAPNIKEESGIESSLNYLASKVLKTADLPLPAYWNYTTEIEKEFPIISAMKVQDKDGNIGTAKDFETQLNKYAKLQYYQLFETQK